MVSFTDMNRRNWDERAEVHYASGYGLSGFRETKCSLMPLELTELGEVSGKKLLHLQCHFGMDTLSWAVLGAAATGIA